MALQALPGGDALGLVVTFGAVLNSFQILMNAMQISRGKLCHRRSSPQQIYCDK
jgi:hypothetical protein